MQTQTVAYLSLRLLMYLRTHYKNEVLRLKYTKLQNQNIYITKKVKTHKIHHLHTASAIGILEKVRPEVQLSKRPNK